MKRIIAAILFVVVCMMCLVIALAETNGDFEYTVLNDGTAQITKYNGQSALLTIPKALDGCAVTSIGDSAFNSCSRLKSVVISDGITSIGNEAFYYCENLTSIKIPNSVAIIGDYAFYYCVNLKTLKIPDSVTTVGANPFGYCKSLSSLVVSKEHPSLATIDGVLFSNTDKRLIWYPMCADVSSYHIP